MREIKIIEHISLDGVIRKPGATETWGQTERSPVFRVNGKW